MAVPALQVATAPHQPNRLLSPSELPDGEGDLLLASRDHEGVANAAAQLERLPEVHFRLGVLLPAIERHPDVVRGPGSPAEVSQSKPERERLPVVRERAR